jgi:hypothetical protein
MQSKQITPKQEEIWVSWGQLYDDATKENADNCQLHPKILVAPSIKVSKN